MSNVGENPSSSPRYVVHEVFKVHGVSFSMRVLADRIERDYIAKDSGCAYVQTVETAGGKSVRRRYFFDGDAIFDHHRNIAAPLEGVKLEDPVFDITIGNVWESPLGTAVGTVEAVVMPWTEAVSDDIRQEQNISPLTIGRKTLDWVMGNNAPITAIHF